MLIFPAKESWNDIRSQEDLVVDDKNELAVGSIIETTIIVT